MTKTNHIQSGIAYCYLKQQIVAVPGDHVTQVCLGERCPYMNGNAQGEGIECLWDDGTNLPFAHADPFTMQRQDPRTRRATRRTRLGQ